MPSTMAPDLAHPTQQPHDEHPSHAHLHDRWCGHAQVTHGDHLDFLHDGHLHHPDGDHVDEGSSPGSALHLPHGCHMHVHRPDCGHALTTHAGHVDYRHGEHLHAVHGDHYDEH
jgi:hypothetical protein